MNKASFSQRFINIIMIDIQDRQRRTFTQEALDELKRSIAQHGLFHAPILREGHILVGGWRRLQAMIALHVDHIPFTYNNELVPENCIPFVDVTSTDVLDAMEKELDENLIREDISWQDKVRAQSEIHKLRLARNPDQTYKKTAEEIVTRTASGDSRTIQAEISRAMVTSEFLDHPAVRSAKNERWAFNAAAQILRDDFAEKLGRNVKSRHTILDGSAEKHLPKLIKQKKKFRCFIIDPPYGIDADTFHPGNSPAEQLHKYQDDIDSALAFSSMLFHRCSELATHDAHLWMFCDIELFLELRKVARSYGWTVFRTPLIWSKGSTGYILRKANIRRGSELLLFAQRSDTRGLSQVLQDVIPISSRDGEKIHAAQKPVAIYELLLKLSCLANDEVLDPCCGSGTIFHAAQTVKVSATGIENDPHYSEICKKLLVELETNAL